MWFVDTKQMIGDHSIKLWAVTGDDGEIQRCLGLGPMTQGRDGRVRLS
jgi:hypothetical protein